VTPGPAAAGGVLCGGRSSRFGRDKALVDAGGVPLGRRVVDALRSGGADPVVAVGGTAGNSLAVPTVPDRMPGAGPLAALATVLLWAGTGLVVVAPCDLPLLSGAHVAALIERAGPSTAAIAVIEGRPQPSLACWPASFGPILQRAVAGGQRAWRAALEAGDWTGVALPSAAAADADTPARLASLLALGAEARTNPPGLI
jgi:molybdopterin-guanine dinucleotide biosynthesis protein A